MRTPTPTASYPSRHSTDFLLTDANYTAAERAGMASHLSAHQLRVTSFAAEYLVEQPLQKIVTLENGSRFLMRRDGEGAVPSWLGKNRREWAALPPGWTITPLPVDFTTETIGSPVGRVAARDEVVG